MLWILRPKRRGKNHDHQVPSELAPAQLRRRPRLRAGSAEAGSGGEIALVLRARLGRVLSVDDREPDPGIPRLVPFALESGHRSRFAQALSTRSQPKG